MIYQYGTGMAGYSDGMVCIWFFNLTCVAFDPPHPMTGIQPFKPVSAFWLFFVSLSTLPSPNAQTNNVKFSSLLASFKAVFFKVALKIENWMIFLVQHDRAPFNESARRSALNIHGAKHSPKNVAHCTTVASCLIRLENSWTNSQLSPRQQKSILTATWPEDLEPGDCRLNSRIYYSTRRSEMICILENETSCVR